MNDLTNRELKTLMELSFGRIMRLASRGEKPGDNAEYDKYRNLFMEASEEVKARGIHQSAAW